MTERTVKAILEGHYTGKLVDINIYYNEYIDDYQATVIVINNHIVEQYIVDKTGFINFNIMGTQGVGYTLQSGKDM